MSTTGDLSSTARALLNDVGIVDGVAKLTNDRVTHWVKALAALKPGGSVFMELVAIGKQFGELGHTEAALQILDLVAFTMLPSLQARALQEGTGAVAAAKRAVTDIAARKLPPTAGVAGAFGAHSQGAGIGLRPGPKKR